MPAPPFNAASDYLYRLREEEERLDGPSTGVRRTKSKSDVAGMVARASPRPGGRRARQLSSADVVVKFGYAPQLAYEDLRCVM